MTHVPPPEEPAGPARIRPYLGVSGLGASADATPTGLRPFVLTSGRVDGVDPDIGLETQVTARSDGPLRTGVPVSSLAPELRTITALCAEPISVAEISARARLHLGVTRILVGDLRAAGYLDVHAREAARPDPDTILRVIRGLRAIS
ncbi:DUF742 domain-containing protein [Phytohabitans suffuscus]